MSNNVNHNQNPAYSPDLNDVLKEFEQVGASQQAQYAAQQQAQYAAQQQAQYAAQQQAQYAAQQAQYARQVQQAQQAALQAQQAQRTQNVRNGYQFNFGTQPAAQQAQTVQQSAPAAQSAQPAPREKKKLAPPPSVGKLIRDGIILVGMILIFTISSVVMLSSGIKRQEVISEQKSYFEDLQVELLSFRSDSVSSIFNIPKVYILPWGEQPAPVPAAEGFGSETNEDGVEVLTYKDDTISVKYWMERQYSSNVHFAEIEIAHPTQLRTAYAGGEFGSSTKYMPQVIARQVNAVIAINADYCGYRSGGILVRQNTLYRNTARGWDMLLIDSEGDFHIMQDKDVHASGIMDEYEIVNTLVFGPSLVIDGEVKLLNIESGCGPTWNEQKNSPRTAIGQIGRLHYLFCCVEGRSEQSRGVKTSQMAKIMKDMGCVQAYNLDGGQSTTIIFNGKPMNDPLWGSQRVVTDIVYCATAIPNEEVEAA